MERVFNFAPGPSMLPLPVLEQIQKELLCYGSTGMSVMEMSHRSKMYLDIFNQTVADLREVMAIPDHYKVIFPQGGATAMFAAVAMNLMDGGHADYVDSGNFAHNALVEAQKYGAVNVAGSSRAENYTHIPDYTLSPDAKYVHITTNNTIYGTRWDHIPDTGDVPLVADMSSNILSEVYDVRKFGVIYAGAQKNVAPAGVVILIVREDLLGRALPITPKVMDFAKLAEADSMLNTPKRMLPAGWPSMNGYSSRPDNCTSNRIADGWRVRVTRQRRRAMRSALTGGVSGAGSLLVIERGSRGWRR